MVWALQRAPKASWACRGFWAAELQAQLAVGSSSTARMDCQERFLQVEELQLMQRAKTSASQRKDLRPTYLAHPLGQERQYFSQTQRRWGVYRRRFRRWR